MPGKATTGGPGKGDPQEPSTADCEVHYTAVAGAPGAADQLEEGCSSGVTVSCHRGGSRPDPAMASAAELQLGKSAPGGNDDVISVASSAPALPVKETLESNGDDEVVSIGSYGKRGDPAAGARMQPPAAISVPAAKAMVVSRAQEIGDIVIDLEDSEDTHVPGGQSAPAGRAASSAQASSIAKPVQGAAEAQRSLQAGHLQVLLAAPGIRPAAVCLFREGDVAWLSFYQICNLLLSNAPKVRRHAKKSLGSRRLATCEERAFLNAKGIFRGPRGRATLLDIKAACKLLHQGGASASTVAAVQGLQGAKPLTPAEISHLSPPSAARSAKDGDGGEGNTDEDMPPFIRLYKKPTARLAVQEPQAAGTLWQRAAAALPGPETPVGGRQKQAAGWAKRTSSEAFGPCAESLGGSKSLRARGSSEAKRCPAGRLRIIVPPASPTRSNPPRRAQAAAMKPVSQPHQRAPTRTEPSVETEEGHAPTQGQIAARAAKYCPPPFGMGADGVPPTPLIVEDAELVAEQENLVENVFSRKVYEEYQRRWDAALGQPWRQGVVSEYFLRAVVSYNRTRSDKAKTSVVQQVAKWLAFSPEQKRLYMEERTIAVELTDMRHPAFKRFKEVLEPLGLRKKERALHFCKNLPEWTLLGEYCGVWDMQAAPSGAEGGNRPDIEDPIGLGPLLYDKVSDLAYSSKTAPEAAVAALRIKWADAVQLDPSRAHNQLCLINDFRGVPGAPEGNVAWVEMEDSRTLRPHLFIFTAVSVRPGQEVLLDYGEDYHQDMEPPLKKAAHLVETQPEAMAVHRALKAREDEAIDKAREVQDLQRALQQEGAERMRLEKEAAQLKEQAEEEQARFAVVQQQMLQAQETALRLGKAIAEERVQRAAQAKHEQAGAAGLRYQLEWTEGEVQKLEKRSQEDRAQVKAQAVTAEGFRCHIKRLYKERSALQEVSARAKSEAAAEMQQLEAALQECTSQQLRREADLQQARTAAQSSRKEFQAHKAMHQDTCERSAAEIDRLSRVGRCFELELAQLTKHSPPGMAAHDLPALGRNAFLQVVAAGSQYPCGVPRPSARRDPRLSRAPQGERSR